MYEHVVKQLTHKTSWRWCFQRVPWSLSNTLILVFFFKLPPPLLVRVSENLISLDPSWIWTPLDVWKSNQSTVSGYLVPVVLCIAGGLNKLGGSSKNYPYSSLSPYPLGSRQFSYNPFHHRVEIWWGRGVHPVGMFISLGIFQDD